jgi:multiple sugar transport system substrate-binding protein
MSQNKISRREFLKYTSLATAGLALSACTPAATQAPPTTAATQRPTIDIDWWTVAGADVGDEQSQRAWVAEFQQKAEAGQWVKVNATFLPDDGFSEKMTTVLGTGSGVPDVTTFWNADWFPQALDLRDYIQRDGIDINMYSKVHFDSRCRFGEQIIGLPIGVGATMYFYNQTLFEEKGLPTPTWGYTMQQWLEDAVKLTDKSKKVFGAAMPTRVWRAEFFAFGARPFDDEGKGVDGFMNGPKTVAAFEFMWDLAHSGAVPTFSEFEALRTEGTGPIDLFETGRLGFAGLNNGQFQRVDASGVKFGLVHNPKVEGEDVITNGWTLQLGIPKASQKQDAAWEWLKWMTGMDGQRFLQSLNKGYTANLPALWTEHPAKDDERVKFFFEILKTPQVWEFSGRFPYFGKVTRLNQELYDRIYLGDIERDQIKAELDKVVPQAQEIVDTERKALGLG